MQYIDYIKLGFVRVDYDDTVFNRTGYHPFILERIINDRMKVYATSEELDKPILQVGKDEDKVERIYLTESQVFKIFGE